VLTLGSAIGESAGEVDTCHPEAVEMADEVLRVLLCVDDPRNARRAGGPNQDPPVLLPVLDVGRGDSRGAQGFTLLPARGH